MENEWEFEQVYDIFQPKIYRYLTRLMGAKEAEDLTQEVFIKVNAALDSFRHESQLSTWIYRIATNTAIDRIRDPAFKRDAPQELLESGLSETEKEAANAYINISPGSCSIEDEVANRETGECIRGVIEKLPENYRMIVILSELEGLPNKEIAKILGLSLDTVKIRLHRGKDKLKKELLDYCSFYWDERNELNCDPKAPVKKE